MGIKTIDKERKLINEKDGYVDGYRSIARIVWFLFLSVDRHSSLGRWRRSCTALKVAARRIVSGRRLRHLHSPVLFHPSFIAGTCKNLAYLPFFLPTRNVTISPYTHAWTPIRCALARSLSLTHTHAHTHARALAHSHTHKTMPQSHCWELRVSPLTNYTSNSTIPLCDFYLDALLFQSHLALELLAES